MSEEGLTQVPAVFSSKERAALVAKALSEAARRARFSTRRQRALPGGSMKARRSERMWRLFKIWTFVAIVGVPSLAGALYYGFIASDQYTAEARFTLRGGLPSAINASGSMSSAPAMMIIQDTQIVMSYMRSRALVEQLQRSIGLTHFFEGSDIDYFSRLGEHKPIERILKYWKHQIDLAVQMPAGIVVLTVRAFRPQDAVTIADAVLESSDVLVNRMNDQMRDDALAMAEKERIRAQDNLAVARTSLEKARNAEGVLSGKDMAKAMTELETDVRGQLIKLQQQYDAQRRFVRVDAPQMRNLQTKIDAMKEQIAKLQEQMTSRRPETESSRPLSGSMSRLDYASLNNEIADKMYAMSLAMLEHVKIASEMKLMYINTFVMPAVAEEAKYPRRLLDITLVIVGSVATWGAALGLVFLLRRSMT